MLNFNLKKIITALSKNTKNTKNGFRRWNKLSFKQKERLMIKHCFNQNACIDELQSV